MILPVKFLIPDSWSARLGSPAPGFGFRRLGPRRWRRFLAPIQERPWTVITDTSIVIGDATYGYFLSFLGPSGAKPLPEDQHLFEPPPPIVKPPPEPLIVKGRIKIEMTFEADIALLARRFEREFASHPPEGNGYYPWEQASTFLWELVNDSLDHALHATDGLKDTSYSDPEIDFTWTKKLADELNERLGIEVES